MMNISVLRDFGPYAERQEAVGRAYENRTKWLEMSILNIAQSGHFASLSNDFAVQ